MAPLVGDAAGDGDVLVARATPVGTGALAIVRLSGPAGRVLALAREMAPRIPVRPVARRAYLSPFLDEEGASSTRASCSGSRLPRRRPARRSSSCRRTAPPPWSSCSSLRPCAGGARRARPGEFTRRALANGKIDLARAEGIGLLAGGGEPGGGPAGARPRPRRAFAQGGGAQGGAPRRSRGAGGAAGFRRGRREEPESGTALSRIVSARAALLLAGSGDGRGPSCEAVPTVVIVGRPERREVDAVQRASRRGPGPGDGARGDDARRRGRGVRGRMGNGSASSTRQGSGRRRRGSSGSGWRPRDGRPPDADLLLVAPGGREAKPPLPGSLPGGVPVLLLATKADLPGESREGELRVSARTGEGMTALRREIVGPARRAAGSEGEIRRSSPGSGRRCRGAAAASTASRPGGAGRDRRLGALRAGSPRARRDHGRDGDGGAPRQDLLDVLRRKMRSGPRGWERDRS